MRDLSITFGRTPFVYFVIALVLGIMVASFIPVSILVYRFIVALFFINTALFIGFSLISKWKNHRLFPVFGLLFFSVLSFAGWIFTWRDHPTIAKKHYSNYSSPTLYGFIASQPKVNPNSVTAEFNVTHAKQQKGKILSVKGKLLLRINNLSKISIKYGDELILSGEFEDIPPAYNPNEFDYKAYLANKNIWHQRYLHPSKLVKTGKIKGNLVIRNALLAREGMVSKINRYFKNKDAVAIISTLVLGYRADLDQELVKAFSSTGTIHVLAVSGMHVGIVFLFLSFSLRWMKTRSLRIVRFVTLLLSIWCFALITGFSASVLRAAIMISFVMIANTFSRQRNTANNIAASAFFLLLYNPKYIAEIGFQLSYLAVIGIIWIMPSLNKIITSSNALLSKLWNSIVLSCSAQLTTFPLVLYYFHLFPVYFLPANLFIIIPVSVIIYTGFFLLLLPVHPITDSIAYGLERFIVMVNKGLLAMERWPGSTVTGVWIEPYQCLLIYLVIVFLIIAYQYAHKKALYLAVVLLLVLGLFYNYRVLRNYRSDQLIIFNTRKNLVIGFIHKARPIIYSDLTLADKAIQYSVVPALEANAAINKLKEVKTGKIFQSGGIAIDERTIQFMGRELVIEDGKKKKSRQLSSPHWLLIRNNPTATIAEMLKNIGRDMLLILDASNNDETIRRFCDEAGRMDIEVYILKDNFAYVWNAY